MTDQNTQPADTSPLSFNEVVEFFRKKNVATRCPTCLTDASWDVVASLSSPPSDRYRSLSEINESGTDLFAGGTPVVTVTCSNCGYLRLHSIAMLRKILAREAYTGEASQT